MWELDHKQGWATKNWCFWTVVLERTLESPLDCKEIKPVNPKGNQSSIFIRRTDAEAPILWPPDVKNWFIWKDPDAGKDWRREEKGMTKDEMVRKHPNSMDTTLSKLQEIVKDKEVASCGLKSRTDLVTEKQQRGTWGRVKSWWKRLTITQNTWVKNWGISLHKRKH